MTKRIKYILYGFASISTIYIFLATLPVFNFYFYDEDLFIFNLGSMLKHNPFAWFNFEYLGWWRPLGFGLQAVAYLIFGLMRLPYHIIGFLMHIITALSVAYFTKRLFSEREALLAYIFFIVAPFSVCLVGYAVVGFEDALATTLVLLALGRQLRGRNAGSLSGNAYWLSSILFFLAALCKEIWIGFIPATLLIDFINYPSSTFFARMKRLYVFILPFIAILLRLAILGYSFVMIEQSKYIKILFSLDNILKSATLSFLPENIPNNIHVEVADFSWLRILVPILIISFSIIIIAKEKRFKFMTLIIMYLCSVLTISFAPLNFYFVGWQHYIPVFAITSPIISLFIWELVEKSRMKILVYIATTSIFIIFQIMNYSTIKLLINELKQLSEENYKMIKEYKDLFRSFPIGTHIFFYGNIRASELYNENFVPSGIKLTGFFIKERYHVRTDDYVIMGRKEIVKRELRKYIYDDRNIFLIDNLGQIKDCKEMVLDILTHDYSYEQISDIIRKQRSQ